MAIPDDYEHDGGDDDKYEKVEGGNIFFGEVGKPKKLQNNRKLIWLWWVDRHGDSYKRALIFPN